MGYEYALLEKQRIDTLIAHGVEITNVCQLLTHARQSLMCYGHEDAAKSPFSIKTLEGILHTHTHVHIQGK